MFEKESQIEFLKIAEEIDAMVIVDQDMREKWFITDEWDVTVDKNNTVRMKEIVAEIGWPTISKVGKESSKNAWLLVQHADHDVEFQKLCLALMIENQNDTDKRHIAYLTDRVLVNSHEPQIYGTQFNETPEKGHFPRDIENPESVDERRKEMGLGTMEEYTKMMHKKYVTKKS